MKNFQKIVGICLVMVLSIACSSDDSVSETNGPFTGDVVLQTQAEVDEFGANNYSGINGSLRITFESTSTASTITDIGSLSSLTFITGDLAVTNNGLLSSLNGLNNISTIGNSLFVNTNDALLNIDGLSNLTQVGENIVVVDNKVLTNIDALTGITSVAGNLTIGSDQAPFELSNEKLTSIEGLSNVISVGGDMFVSGNLIQDLSGLEKLTTVNGFLKISFNTQMTSLTGIENLTSVGGRLEFRNNYSLVNLNSLSNLSSVGEALEIIENTSLTSISGLYGLESLDGFLVIESNDVLLSLGDAFPALTSAMGISTGGSSFPVLEGFNALTNVGFIALGGDENLVSINGFNNLQTVTTLTIGGAEQLASVSGFQNLNTVTDFSIIQPTTITDQAFTVNTFTSLTTVLNDLTIEGLANSNIDYLSSIETVGNDVNILVNENLNDLCGLNTLIFNNGVGGDFNIFQNAYNPTQQDILNGNCSQ